MNITHKMINLVALEKESDLREEEFKSLIKLLH
jgi:hypothetical protein